MKRANERRLISGEICFMKRTVKYIFVGNKRNEDIVNKL
jgi:hypothetical protein